MAKEMAHIAGSNSIIAGEQSAAKTPRGTYRTLLFITLAWNLDSIGTFVDLIEPPRIEVVCRAKMKTKFPLDVIRF